MIKKANPKKSFSKRTKCPVCKCKFTVTLKKNIKKKIKKDWIDDKEKRISGGFFGTDKIKERSIYRVIVVYKSVCPNCGHKEELFYVPTKEKIYTKWGKSHYID